MYLCNHVALALGLEGNPDPSQAMVAAAVAKHSYKGYVAPDYVVAAPAGGGPAPAGGSPPPPPPAPARVAAAKR